MGGGSYEKIMERVRATGIDAVARVTLTKKATDIARIVRHLIEAGFKEVGVSPVAAGDHRFDLGKEELAKVLEGMRALADDFVAGPSRARSSPSPTCARCSSRSPPVTLGRQAPCGAATALAAADNKGDLYACHRLVGNETFKIGNVKTGVDSHRRLSLLEDMHPRGRAPCQACWARYLCAAAAVTTSRGSIGEDARALDLVGRLLRFLEELVPSGASYLRASRGGGARDAGSAARPEGGVQPALGAVRIVRWRCEH